MLGFVFTRARAIESRTTQLARDSSSRTLVHVASQVMVSQTRLKWLLGESDLQSQTRPSKGGFTRQSNAGDGYLQPANDGGNLQHQLVRSA